MVAEYIAENTDEWYQEKTGLFSSSQVVALLKPGKRPMTKAEIEAKKIQDKKDRIAGLTPDSRRTVDTLFGEGAESYINLKVAESINGRMKETPTTRPMQRGLTLEHEALKLFTTITGIQMFRSGLFRKPDLNFGGTPDGISIKRNKISAIAEVKCFNEDKHSEICEFSGSQANQARLLREYDEGIYTQCQMNLYATDCDVCYFISYDNRPMGYSDDTNPIEGNLKPENWPLCIKIIKIKRDQAFIDNMIYRLEKAYGIFIDKKILRIKYSQKMIMLAERTAAKRKAA